MTRQEVVPDTRRAVDERSRDRREEPEDAITQPEKDNAATEAGQGVDETPDDIALDTTLQEPGERGARSEDVERSPSEIVRNPGNRKNKGQDRAVERESPAEDDVTGEDVH